MQRHRLVMDTLKAEMEGQVHALSIQVSDCYRNTTLQIKGTALKLCAIKDKNLAIDNCLTAVLQISMENVCMINHQSRCIIFVSYGIGFKATDVRLQLVGHGGLNSVMLLGFAYIVLNVIIIFDVYSYKIELSSTTQTKLSMNDAFELILGRY